jgi:hypothetical protein
VSNPYLVWTSDLSKMNVLLPTYPSSFSEFPLHHHDHNPGRLAQAHDVVVASLLTYNSPNSLPSYLKLKNELSKAKSRR